MYVSGGVAAKAVRRKEQKYASLPAGHLFIPMTVDNLGAFGPYSGLQLNPGRGDLGNFCSRDYLLQCKGGTAFLS